MGFEHPTLSRGIAKARNLEAVLLEGNNGDSSEIIVDYRTASGSFATTTFASNPRHKIVRV
jgi:hypothetical protein